MFTTPRRATLPIFTNYDSKPDTGTTLAIFATLTQCQIPLDAPREADALHRYRPGQQNAHTAANSRTHTRPPISFLMLVAAYATADTENRTQRRPHRWRVRRERFSWWRPDCVAEDAVRCEPVSPS